MLEPAASSGALPQFLALHTRPSTPDAPIDFLSLEDNQQQNHLRLRSLGEAMFPEQFAACRAYGRQMLRHVTDVFDTRQVQDIWWSFLNWDGPPFPAPDGDPRYLPRFARESESWETAMQNAARREFNMAIDAWRAGVPVEHTPVQFREQWSPRPEPQPYGVSDEGAEQYIADWMKYLGVRDAEVTPYGNDGGIDVSSTTYIAQVKNYGARRSVGVASIREFAGVTHLDGRRGLFFTSGTFAAGAATFADQAGILLFRYRAELGTLDGIGNQAERSVISGLLTSA